MTRQHHFYDLPCSRCSNRRGRALLVTSIMMTVGIVVMAWTADVGYKSTEPTIGSTGTRGPQEHPPFAPRASRPPLETAPTFQHGPTMLMPPPSLPIAAQHMARYVPDEQPAIAQRWAVPSQPTPACSNPSLLIEEVEELGRAYPGAAWPFYVRQTLERLNAADVLQEQDALAELASLCRPSVLEAEPIRDDAQRRRMLAVCSTIQRRVVVWQQLSRIAFRGQPGEATHRINTYAMWLQIQEAADAIPYPQSQAWQEYLQFDQLESALRDEPKSRDELAHLARRLLERIHSPRLNARQRQLLDCPEIDRLTVMLRHAATRPVDIAAVVNAVERFEASRSDSDGEDLAKLARQMRWSTDPLTAELARSIDQHYRAPNLRVSISSNLLNRLLSQTLSDTQPVQQNTGQAHVVGKRQTQTDLAVRLIPADDQWRLHLTADGQITADTTVYAGPATFFVNGAGTFKSNKLLSIDRHDVALSPAEATGEFGLTLAGYQTSMDGLPLLRRVARDTALTRFQQQQAAAQQQMQLEVRNQAKAALDEQAQEFFAGWQQQFETKALASLRRIGLPLAPIQLKTTDDQLLGKYRLAGLHDTAACTPAPPPPKGSVLDVQLHQSAINNVIDGLGLNGRCESLKQLCRECCQNMNVVDDAQLEQVPESITVHFADERPLRVQFADGGANVALRLAALDIHGKQWQNLTARCVYQFDANPDAARLLHVASITVDGDDIGLMDRIVLQGVFTKVFSSAGQLPAISELLARRPGMEDLIVTQSSLEDGWLALAIGPRR